ncbi:MAG: 2,4-dihydroxyhept-2-ene,7-dioic acid aldolase, partial [Bacillota bacterium]|nr:2,4-dihydroxyhept-2-ene,7-dioic acid aldolase [Bacillota bacterium]
ALERVDRIAATDGVDLLFLGPADLSYSLGCDSDIVNGGLSEAFLTIKNAAQSHGKMMGTLINSEEKLKFCLENDVRFIVWDTDLNMLKNQMMQVLKMIRSNL